MCFALARLALAGLLAAGAFSGCRSASGSSRDGAALGTPYPCTGGIYYQADGAAVSAPADAGPQVTCVVGQSFCSVGITNKAPDVLPVHSCETLPGGGLGPCAETPTCACICQQGIICVTNCACDDSGGFVTITCEQI
jgi:hypothetical protein